MSQFDLPRFHFQGELVMHVGTANNAFYHPLIIFDPLHSEPVCPPVIQLTPDSLPKAKPYIPPGSYDTATMQVTILPISTDDAYVQWAQTPLGSCNLDADYHDLYDHVIYPNEGKPLTGINPGYWNYFGDMSYAYRNASITGITLQENAAGQVRSFGPSQRSDCPDELSGLFDLQVSLRSDPAQVRSNTGIMCDVNAEGTSVTQLFCNAFTISDDAEIVFQGTPGKATTRMLNLSKVPNAIPGPEMGGAVFYWAIPEENIGERGDLYDAVKKHYSGSDEVVGLMIRQVIHRVFEVRNPNYEDIGQKPNPALGRISGTIAPLLASDLKTMALGRRLNPTPGASLPVSTPIRPPKGVQMGPMPYRIAEDRSSVTIDLLSALPELITKEGDRRATTPESTPPEFEVADVGDFHLVPDPNPENASAIIPSAAYTGQAFASNGGVVDVPFNTAPSTADTSFNLVLASDGSVQASDARYVIVSDQTGIYAEQGSASDVFLNDGLPLVPCTLRVFDRGTPVPENAPILCLVQQIEMTPEAPAFEPQLNSNFPFASKPVPLHDSVELKNIFETARPGTFVYVFIPPGGTPLKKAEDFDQSSQPYITLRVLGQAPATLNSSGTPTWDELYENVLRLYTLIYPAMGTVLKFDEETWANGSMAGMIVNRTHPDRWSDAEYMPRTRDLSAWQRDMIQRWASQFNVTIPPSNEA